MSVIFTAPGRPMSAGNGKAALWRSLRESVTGGPPYSDGPPPTAIQGLAGWWDASGFNGLMDSSGQPLTSWNQSSFSVQDKSGGQQPLTAFSANAIASPMSATPRLAGTHGGIGAVIQGSGLLMPALSPYHGLLYTGRAPGSDGWTWWIVWSRPNWRQGTNADGQPATILAAGQTPIIQVDNSGGSGRLILFPGSSAKIISSGVTRRHTHSIILRNSIGGGIDAWLDGTLVASGVANALPASAVGPTYLLHDGTPIGAAQCWFHEAASWSRSISNAEVTSLTSYASRWPTGSRRGVILLINGQSNAINYALNDGAASLLARGIAWHTGALAYNILASIGGSSSYTMAGGHGIYPAGQYPGSFLDPAGNGAGDDPATWPLGADGIASQTALQSQKSEDIMDVCALVWPWSETDSLRNYGEKGVFLAAAARFVTLERAAVGKNSAQLPLIWWNAIPYGTVAGIQMHREVTATLAATPTLNVVIGNPQTSDSNPRGSSWDPSTGTTSGGDVSHRDSDDNRRFARLAAPIAARAVLASGYGDSINAIPSGLPSVGGPRIVHAYLRDSTTVILTVQHDCGTDIKVPLQAATGAGFTIMDGGSVANPGNLVQAASCQRLDATHLLLTISHSLVSATSACALFYPYGPAAIGRGNAITDNYSFVAKPANWDISADLGPAWNLDYPLAATTAPIFLSSAAL